MKSAITTHVLDLSSGLPGHGIRARLEYEEQPNHWQRVGAGVTDPDGRITDLLPSDPPLRTGCYRLVFELKDYHRSAGRESFHPRVTIDFNVRDPDQHYHVPLLLSPFGYSTYRGS